MVRCADCGFLTFHNPETRCLESVDEDTRKTGRFPAFGTKFSIGTGPRCFRMAADLGSESKEVGKEIGVDNPLLVYLSVLNKDRTCEAFAQWHPGFSPKEHREMLFDIERKKLELEEKKTERQWKEQRERREQRFQLFNTLISALAGALFTAIIAWLWTGKSDTKPTIIVQPIQVEKDASKTTK